MRFDAGVLILVLVATAVIAIVDYRLRAKRARRHALRIKLTDPDQRRSGAGKDGGRGKD